MAAEDREYVIASLEYDGCDTDVLTVELPSREIVAQLEVPRPVLERIDRVDGVSREQTLAERLEINRARISLRSARQADGIDRVREHLADAKRYLSGVEALDTAQLEAEIEGVWVAALDSAV